jgi:hypothetical protein
VAEKLRVPAPSTRVSFELILPPLTVNIRERLPLALNECEFWGGEKPGNVVKIFW